MSVFPEEPRLPTERERVEDWREYVLIEAGYPIEDAISLSRSDCDLHRAVELLKAGCSIHTALEILL